MNRTTAKQFKAKVEKAFRSINPDVPVSIEWRFVTRGYVPYKSGPGTYRGGHFLASAPGHRAILVFADIDDEGRLSIR